MLAASGIHPTVAQARGYRTVRTVEELRRAINVDVGAVEPRGPGDRLGAYIVRDDDDDGSVRLTVNYRWPDGHEETGRFGVGQLRFPALLLPVRWNGHVVGHRLRPDHPRTEKRDGRERVVKYEQPAGLPTHLDANPAYWPYVVDAAYPLAVTEGEKKVDALSSAGVAALGLVGVWNWQRKSGTEHVPHPEWSDIPLTDRPVYVVFDSDAEVNEQVQKARTALTDFLRRRGAKVLWTRLPAASDGGKLGPDDALAAGWTWQQIAATAAPPPNPMGFRSLADVRKAYRQPEWLVREFLLSSAFMGIGGAEKTLKSWFAVATALALATGRPLFNAERFAVPARRRVVVLTGEGGSDLVYDRLLHLARLYGLSAAELEAACASIHVSDRIYATHSTEFRQGLAWEVADFDPAAVILDPAYVYVDPGDGNGPGNVFKMGKLLADLRDQLPNRALVVAHHFTKAGAEHLRLDSFTQAGFREVLDHWLLLRHAQEADLDSQRFTIDAVMGARRGFGWTYRMEIELGRIDLETLRHAEDAKPVWNLVGTDIDSAEGEVDWRQQVYAEVCDHPGEFTQSDLTRRENGKSRTKALQFLEKHGIVVSASLPGPNGERRSKRFRPALDVVTVDDALKRLRLENV